MKNCDGVCSACLLSRSCPDENKEEAAKVLAFERERSAKRKSPAKSRVGMQASCVYLLMEGATASGKDVTGVVIGFTSSSSDAYKTKSRLKESDKFCSVVRWETTLKMNEVEEKMKSKAGVKVKVSGASVVG